MILFEIEMICSRKRRVWQSNNENFSINFSHLKKKEKKRIDFYKTKEYTWFRLF